MTLLRAGYRTLLASYFVVNGIKAVRDPGPLVPVAEPLAARLVPLAKQYAPPQVAGYVPEDTETLVRVNGLLQLVGALALASGKGRRLGAVLLAVSLVPSTIAKHAFWSATDPETAADQRAQFLKNTSLLGGVLIAAADTEGKPSIGWRVQKSGQVLARETRRTGRKVAKETSDLTDSALAEGAALVGAVVASSKKARKKAAKELTRSTKAAQSQAARMRKASEEARRRAEKQAKAARRERVAKEGTAKAKSALKAA